MDRQHLVQLAVVVVGQCYVHCQWFLGHDGNLGWRVLCMGRVFRPCSDCGGNGKDVLETIPVRLGDAWLKRG